MKFNFKLAKNSDLDVRGYASVFNVPDYQNDIILPGAFKKSVQNHHVDKRIKFLWQHKHDRPIGVIDELYEDHKGLFVKASINQETKQGNEVIALIKQKALDSLSIGFTIEKSCFNDDGKREISEVNLWEISVVTFPANSSAKLIHCSNSLLKLSIACDNANKTIFNLIKKGTHYEYR